MAITGTGKRVATAVAAGLTGFILSGTVAAAQPFIADGDPDGFSYRFARTLYWGSLPEALALAEAEIPAEGEVAVFAKGAAEFLLAVEGLAQDLHRYGRKDTLLDFPVMRLPIPPNVEPEPIGYEDFRALQQRFVDRLAVAEATLATLGEGDYVLQLRPGGALIDLNGDGEYAVYERLDAFITAIMGLPGDADWLERQTVITEFAEAVRAGDAEALAQLDTVAPLFAFDAADVAWLRGYANLLSAMMEIPLAHGWKASFDQIAPFLFARADTPYPKMAEIYGDADWYTGFGARSGETAVIFDLLAFAVYSPWATTEPERLSKARLHLKEVIVQSRRSWALIAEETDTLEGSEGGANEWIPGPQQRQWLASLPVQTRTVEGWGAFLETFDKVLDGELLLPHWRFEQGVNVRRLFEEATELSPILILQGTAVLPFLEEGPEADGEHWDSIMQLLDGNLFGYMVWFN